MSRTLFFLDYLSRGEQRHYIVLLDRGEAVQGLRFLQATKALTALVPFVKEVERDGLTLHVLGQKVSKFAHLKSQPEVDAALAATALGGETCLAGPLADAVRQHLSIPTRPTSILVLTAGVIKDKLEAAKVIVDTSHQLRSNFELTISFMQVGDDPRGTSYLTELSQHLGHDCKFRIVDAITAGGMAMDIEAYLNHSGKLRTFAPGAVPKPAPFKTATPQGQAPGAGGRLSPANPNLHGGINAAIRGSASPKAAPAADAHGGINAAIRGLSLGQQPPQLPQPLQAAPVPHVGINDAIRRACAGQATAPVPVPVAAPVVAHDPVNDAIRRATGGAAAAPGLGGHVSPTRPGGSSDHSAIDQAIRKATPGTLPIQVAFLDAIKTGSEQDYVVLLDCSENMSAHRWNSARQALAKLGPLICALDSDGINLYLFNETWKKASNIVNGAIVDDVFMKHVPHGRLLLAPVLNAALTDYFSNTRQKKRRTAILVLVAGLPADFQASSDLLVQAANTVAHNQELTVSILQVGHHDPFVTDLVSQCNARARNRIVDGHSVGFDTSFNDGIPLERFIEKYYSLWPQYVAQPSFEIKDARHIIEYHKGTFSFQ